jgi:hypothetical protein
MCVVLELYLATNLSSALHFIYKPPQLQQV